jgi:drug/metabolite transporter (DMT)-like permease
VGSAIGIGVLVIVAILTGVGHICFKMVTVRDLTLRQKLADPRFLVGASCFVLGALLAIVAAKYVHFSLLYAMTSLNFIFILLFSHWWLGETADRRKICGVAVIVLGLLIIALDKY